MYRFPIQVSQHKESSTPLAAALKKALIYAKLLEVLCLKEERLQHTGWDLAENRKIPQKIRESLFTFQLSNVNLPSIRRIFWKKVSFELSVYPKLVWPPRTCPYLYRILKNLLFLSFALSCDAFLEEVEEGDEELCKCKPHYEGSRCEKCGPGYYGQPEVIGDYCKPCECNGNIEVTDPESCDSVSGICQKCLFDTTGDQCERCENWFFGDAINAKNCRECSCDREGTLECDHMTGDCNCLPGVEGTRCDMCEADHWGFDSDPPVR